MRLIGPLCALLGAALLPLLAGSAARAQSDKTSKWPLIAPLSWTGKMDLLGPPTMIPIRSASGAILYRLYCSSYISNEDDEPKWLTGGDSYEGEFECLLTNTEPGNMPSRTTLLNYNPDDTSMYHTNEGSFQWKELLGKCWNNPDWGADRMLYLRGMRLRIQVLAMEVNEFYYNKYFEKNQPIIQQVTAKIAALPDASATTALARPPLHREPTACLGGY